VFGVKVDCIFISGVIHHFDRIFQLSSNMLVSEFKVDCLVIIYHSNGIFELSSSCKCAIYHLDRILEQSSNLLVA
jgi:hypothetical protein